MIGQFPECCPCGENATVELRITDADGTLHDRAFYCAPCARRLHHRIGDRIASDGSDVWSFRN